MTTRSVKQSSWQYKLTMRLLRDACLDSRTKWIWVTIRAFKAAGEDQEISAMLALTEKTRQELNVLLCCFVDETLQKCWLEDSGIYDVQVILDFYREDDPPCWSRKWSIRWKSSGGDGSA